MQRDLERSEVDLRKCEGEEEGAGGRCEVHYSTLKRAPFIELGAHEGNEQRHGEERDALCSIRTLTMERESKTKVRCDE